MIFEHPSLTLVMYWNVHHVVLVVMYSHKFCLHYINNTHHLNANTVLTPQIHEFYTICRELDEDLFNLVLWYYN